jgi:hypothetical protein
MFCYPRYLFFPFFLFAVLKIEPRASHMRGKLILPALLKYFVTGPFSIVQAGLKPVILLLQPPEQLGLQIFTTMPNLDIIFS